MAASCSNCITCYTSILDPEDPQTEDRSTRSSLDNEQASIFWEKVERFRALLQTAEINVSEIWEDVRDRSPGREVDLW
jgi:hypothetical protein